MKRLYPILLAFILMSQVLPAPLWATVFYMSAGGHGDSPSDGNSCVAAQTITTPKSSYSSAKTCMGGGDTLYIRSGNYTNQQITSPPAGTAGNVTTIMGYPSDPSRPKISFPSSESTFLMGVRVTNTSTYIGRYIKISGLEFDRPYNCYKFEASGGSFFSDHAEFSNNKCYDTVDSGGLIGYSGTNGQGSSFMVIEDNEFSTIGKNYATPPYVPGHNTIYGIGNNGRIRGNYIHDVQHGIAIWGEISSGVPSYQNDNLIENNRLARVGRVDLNPWMANQGLGVAIAQTTKGTGNLMINNIVYDSFNTCVVWAQGNAASGTYSCAAFRLGYYFDPNFSVKAYNNTVYNMIDSDACGFVVDSKSGSNNLLSVEVKNNIIYGGGTAICSTGTLGFAGTTFDGDITKITNNLTSNPLFVNAGAADFHISAGSPAIGFGQNLSSVFTVDADGNTRPSVGAWAAGAYESAVVTPPTPLNLHLSFRRASYYDVPQSDTLTRRISNDDAPMYQPEPSPATERSVSYE